MSTSSNGLRTFGPFELDLDRRELRKDGVRVRVTAKPFDTLAFLVENRRQIVSRDQLRATIWEGLTVSDPAVEHAVNKVRKALGEDPANPCFIQTLWGKGYMFVAEVVVPANLPGTSNAIPLDEGTCVPEIPGNQEQSKPSIVALGATEVQHQGMFQEYAVQVIIACLMYAGLYAVSLLVETAYAFERYQRTSGWVACAIFLWILATTLVAIFADWSLTRKGAPHGSAVAILIMTSAAGALFLVLGSFLPESAITLFSFQGFAAHAAYFKSESYFLILAIVFLVLPFHFIVRVQQEVRAGRTDVARDLLSRRLILRSSPVIVYPRPSGMMILLIVAGFWSLFSVAHLFEHLLPSPYMGRYMNLLQIQRLMYFALGFECLAWYYTALGRLDRSLPSGPTPSGPALSVPIPDTL